MVTLRTFIKNYYKLTTKQRDQVNQLSEMCPNIGQAHRLKELLKIVMDEAYTIRKVGALTEWMKEAWQSNLKPIQNFVDMLRKHW